MAHRMELTEDFTVWFRDDDDLEQLANLSRSTGVADHKTLGKLENSIITALESGDLTETEETAALDTLRYIRSHYNP